jgi:glutamyl/glutaminyl-tRNA synthetase
MSLTRFAPAPTGALHLGHVVNALYVWGWGGARGASVLLRIEDHDRQRAKSEFERALLDDLDWLGFRPAHFPTEAFRAGRCASRQSDRNAIYGDVAGALAAHGRLYGCTCTRRDLVQQRPAESHGVGAYPGTCRTRGIALGDDVAWRVIIDSCSERFDDGLLGPQAQAPAHEHGDIVIRDRRGNWSYQFAVTVDDYVQDVDLVVRGADLLESTGLQIALGRLIGRATPARFAHHPLVMKSETQKLSKSEGDTGIRDLRAAGWSPGRIIGQAAHLVGLAPADAEISAAETVTLFA